MFSKDSSNPCQEVPHLEPVDDHLTVYMGISLDDIRVQGHVFVELTYYGPDQSHPKDFKDMSKRYQKQTLRIKGKLAGKGRKSVQAGHGYWSEEFWECGNALSRDRHKYQVEEEYLSRHPPGMKLRQSLL